MERKTTTIHEFLEFLGSRVDQLHPGERPDATAKIEIDGKKKTIGVVLAEYRLKALPGEATPEREVPLMWNSVQAAIRRLTNHLPALTYTTGEVFLNPHNVPVPSHARKLARELVDLALSTDLTFQRKAVVERFEPKYPLLRKHVEKIILLETKNSRRVDWKCPQAEMSPVGFTPEVILPTILENIKEASSYDWGSVNERWLAIVAPGTTIFHTAGPSPEKMTWPTSGLAHQGISAGFDFIYFWERAYGWYKKIWPPAPPVRKEWRSRELDLFLTGVFPSDI